MTRTDHPTTLPADLAGLPDDRAGLCDDASDLWGWPPRKRRRCAACNEWAEPFEDGSCWRCCATGHKAFIKSLTLPHEWRRLAGGEG